MADITAIILTKNEEKNIKECIRSIVGFVERIVIIDSGSVDKTIAIAKAEGADIFSHEFEYYSKQFNWGLDNTNITTKWVLRLDADERFTPKLCEKANEIIEKDLYSDINGITMEARLMFLGGEIKHGIKNKEKIMIFKFGYGRIEDRKRDAHTILTSGKSKKIHEKFLHYDQKNISSFIDRYNYYASKEVEDYLSWVEDRKTDRKINSTIISDSINKKRKKKFGIYYRAPMFFRSKLWFIYNYYFKIGFLDGRRGYIYHFLECYWYRLLVDVKIFEKEILKKNENRKN